jgi:transcriptional regulator with XRE-family HTH domain
MEFGANLRRVREERGLTLQAVADRTGLSVSYLSEIEQSKKRPSLKTARKIAESLGLPLSNLLPSQPVEEEQATGLSLGDRLRLAREGRNLTLEDVATQAGISPSYLSQIELGQTAPAVPTLRRLSEALEAPLASLVPQTRDNLGIKVKRLRENLALSRAEVASKAGVSVSLIAQLENGRTQPSLDTLQRLSDVLGVSPCYLIVESPGLEQLMTALNPEIRELLVDPQVASVLRMVCTLSEKEFMFIIKMIQTLKLANFS